MSHLIHDVMGHVAVKRPVTGRIGDEFYVACLSDCDERRSFPATAPTAESLRRRLP